MADTCEWCHAPMQVGPDDHAICALSGGVDSTVAATLVHKALGDRLHCVFVDNGLLRLDVSTHARTRSRCCEEGRWGRMCCACMDGCILLVWHMAWAWAYVRGGGGGNLHTQGRHKLAPCWQWCEALHPGRCADKASQRGLG